MFSNENFNFNWLLLSLFLIDFRPCVHNQKAHDFDPDGIRTHNLLILSQTRYRCAKEPHLWLYTMFSSENCNIDWWLLSGFLIDFTPCVHNQQAHDFHPDMLWTRNLLIWSQTRYRCATESHLWLNTMFSNENCNVDRWLLSAFLIDFRPCVHNQKAHYSDPEVIRTRNPLIWSQTRYLCATESHLWLYTIFSNESCNVD